MGGQRGPCFCPQARHDIERTRRQPRLAGQIGKGECGQARLFRGFQNTGVASRQCGTDRAANDLHRVVPRHDMARDAVGFAQGIDGKAALERDRLAHQLVGRACVEFAIARHGDYIIARLRQRFADIGGLHRGKLFDMIKDQLAEPRQDPAAFKGGQCAPFTRQCSFSSDHRGVDIGAGAARDARDLIARRGVDHGEGVAAGRRAPCAADENKRWVEPRCHIWALSRSGSRGAAVMSWRV